MYKTKIVINFSIFDIYILRNYLFIRCRKPAFHVANRGKVGKFDFACPKAKEVKCL